MTNSREWFGGKGECSLKGCDSIAVDIVHGIVYDKAQNSLIDFFSLSIDL
jgi:hypothetical protein